MRQSTPDPFDRPLLTSAGLATVTITATEIDDDTQSLAPSDDAYVYGGAATTNYGQDPELRVKLAGTVGSTRETFLKFPLASVSSVGSAVLRLWGRASSTASSLTINGQRLGNTAASWTEDTITWNNRPAADPEVLDSEVVGGTAEQLYEFDVSGFVRQQKQAGASSVTLVLRGVSNADPYAIFDSDESADAATRPRLLVTPAAPPPANRPPVANDATFAVPENSGNGTAVGAVAATDPDAGQSLAYAITAGNADGALAINPGTGAITVADGTKLDHETATSRALTVTATDNGSPPLGDGATVTVNVTDVAEAPVLALSGPAAGNEGQSLAYAVTVDAIAGDRPGVTYAWSVTRDGSAVALPADIVTSTSAFAFAPHDNGTYRVRVTATRAGHSATASVDVVAANVAPAIDAAALPPRTFNLNDNVSVSALFGDAGRADTHTATVTWGDGTPAAAATLTEAEGSGVASGDHTYAALGTFTVTFTVTDDDGGSVSRSFAATVVDTPPAAPTGLGLSGTAWIDGVPLAWQDNASDEDAYRVEWYDGEGWSVIAELPASSTSYLDEYPVLGSTNQYRVVAVRGWERMLAAPSAALGAYPIAPPVASDDDNAGPNDRGTLTPFATVHDRPLTFDVAPNDADYDGGPRRIVGFTNPANGGLALNLDGTFTYTPDAKFVGTDTFTYTIHDGSASGAPAKAAVDVTNAAPVAAARDVSVHDGQPPNAGFHDDPVTGTVHATDGDGDAVTFELVEDVTRGALTFNAATGSFSYTWGANFEGSDAFVFRADDGVADGPAARVVIGDHQKLTPVHGNDVSSLRGAGGFFFAGPGHYVIEYLAGPRHGTLTWAGGSSGQSVAYTPQPGHTGLDFIRYQLRAGRLVSKPVEVWFDVDANGTGTGQVLPPAAGVTFFGANAEGPTEYAAIATGFLPAAAAGVTLSPGQPPAHGTIAWEADGAGKLTGGFTYTPTPPPADGEPYRGWDFFSYVVTSSTGVPRTVWVQMDVGAGYTPPAVRPTVDPLTLMVPAPAGEVPATLDGLRAGVGTAKDQLHDLLMALSRLGRGVGQVKDAPDLAVLDTLDAATGEGDTIAGQYDAYISQLAKLNKAAGQFLAAQWYVSQADADAVAAVNRLPLRVGALSASNAKMKELADSLESLGEGASIAVDTATKVVTYAENTHAVLSAVEMAGGVTVLVKTGATLFVKEGLKACAKQAAKEIVQETASALAANLANSAAELAGVSEEHRQYIAIGVDAYQAFALFKAARVKLDPNGACFVAGTQVVTGVRADRSLVTKDIEDLVKGDVVLARDQYDAGDDLDRRRVARVFRRTSDHVRVLTVAGDGGNVETIRTTDEHPFWVEGAGWTDAGDVSVGAVLDQPDGSDAVVLSSAYEAHPGGVTVFNFEVEGDHTYFVADAETSFTSPVWVHNVCVGDRYLARMRSGRAVEFGGVREMRLVRHPSGANQDVRDAFDNREQARFVKVASGGAGARQQLEELHFTPEEIDAMQRYGDLPPEWAVHHKLPIGYGGTNDFDNLVIMRREWHEAIHDEIDREVTAREIDVDAEFDINIPMFEGRFVHGFD